MSNEVCEVCGKKLTKWNHAWGTNKCSPCAKGRSQEAKRHKEADDMQRFLKPFSSLDDILHSPKRGFFAKAVFLLLVVNLVALGGQIAAEVNHNNNLLWIQILSFVIGINIGSRDVFANSNLLDVKRWRTFWCSDLLGYVIGDCLFSFITAMFRAYSKAHGDTSLTSMQGTALQLSMALPSIIGVAFAALVVTLTDRRRKGWVTKKWAEIHQHGEGSNPGPEKASGQS
jgi:hypothetical protein